MKRNTFLFAASLALVAGSMPLAIAADATKPSAAKHPSADKILRQMSDTLAGAKQFSFKGTREISAALAEGKNLQAKSDIEVTVQRPNHVVGISTNSDGTRKMFFDGKDFTLLDGKANMYSTVSLRASLDALPAQLAEKYGFVPPLADFVMSNPYKDLKRRSKSVSYIGTGTAGTPAVESYRLKLAGKLADAELWIGVSDHLPKKMTAKVKGGADAGTDLMIEFTEWNLAAPVTAETFVFVPPKDAQKIPMVTIAEVKAAEAKAAAKK